MWFVRVGHPDELNLKVSQNRVDFVGSRSGERVRFHVVSASDHTDGRRRVLYFFCYDQLCHYIFEEVVFYLIILFLVKIDETLDMVVNLIDW